MPNPRRNPSPLESRLSHSAAPLLALARQISEVETTLVRTHVDANPALRPQDPPGYRTFWAIPGWPVVEANSVLCGARQRCVELTSEQTEAMHSIAECLQRLFEAERDACLAREREHSAEKEAIEARNEARHHATHGLHMERLAHTDELTGLLNRRAFMERWEDESVRSAERDYAIALVVIDADNFKRVNDTFGHLQGDVVLRAIGATLLEVGQTPDIIARLGGDEFAMVTTHATTSDLQELAAEIKSRFGVLATELGVDTTLSIGIVSSDECERSEMVARADAALYQSKAADGNEPKFFSSRMSSFTTHSDNEIPQRRALR